MGKTTLDHISLPNTKERERERESKNERGKEGGYLSA